MVRQTTGGMAALPKEVQTLCKARGLKFSDVAEYRVGGREERKDSNGKKYGVYPVSVLCADGRKYTADVIRFND